MISQYHSCSLLHTRVVIIEQNQNFVQTALPKTQNFAMCNLTIIIQIHEQMQFTTEGKIQIRHAILN